MPWGSESQVSDAAAILHGCDSMLQLLSDLEQLCWTLGPSWRPTEFPSTVKVSSSQTVTSHVIPLLCNTICNMHIQSYTLLVQAAFRDSASTIIFLKWVVQFELLTPCIHSYPKETIAFRSAFALLQVAGLLVSGSCAARNWYCQTYPERQCLGLVGAIHEL